MYSKILENPKAHAKFGVKEGLIFMKNNLSWDVICVSPKAIHKGKRLIEIIINYAHNIIGHFGQFEISQCIRRYFWGQSMSHDIESYWKMCGTFTTSKDTNSKPTGLLRSVNTQIQTTPRSPSTPRSQALSSYLLYSSLVFHRSQAPISITAKRPVLQAK